MIVNLKDKEDVEEYLGILTAEKEKVMQEPDYGYVDGNVSEQGMGTFLEGDDIDIEGDGLVAFTDGWDG